MARCTILNEYERERDCRAAGTQRLENRFLFCSLLLILLDLFLLVDRFNIALFSALQQTHYPVLTVCFLHGCCLVKLLPSRRMFRVHHTAMHQFTATLYSKPHTQGVHVCLAVTRRVPFWQNGRDLLRAAAVTRGWNGYRNKSPHRKLTPDKKNLPVLLPGLEPKTFRSRVRLSATELFPFLIFLGP